MDIAEWLHYRECTLTAVIIIGAAQYQLTVLWDSSVVGHGLDSLKPEYQYQYSDMVHSNTFRLME